MKKKLTNLEFKKIEMKEKEVNGCVPCGPETCSMFQCSF